MRVLNVRNVHEALPYAIRLLSEHGITRDSRNGKVVLIPEPVSVVYTRPWERVLFWPQRDANPFFHLAESLHMIQGRCDVAFLATYAKNILNYSDDKQILWGAYGYRWRHHFGFDQLQIIADTLKTNPDDRRCVLQMWDARSDLGQKKLDHPCNTIATFSRNINGDLDLTVFQRSGDVVWGVLGANAVHFSFLQEYMASWIGCGMGTFTQVVTNFHAYLETFIPLQKDLPKATSGFWVKPDEINDPYGEHHVQAVRLPTNIDSFDNKLKHLIDHVERESAGPLSYDEPFFSIVSKMLYAHYYWRTLTAPERYTMAIETLQTENLACDWIRAGIEWLQRRKAQWESKLEAMPSGNKT